MDYHAVKLTALQFVIKESLLLLLRFYWSIRQWTYSCIPTKNLHLCPSFHNSTLLRILPPVLRYLTVLKHCITGYCINLKAFHSDLH